jgi:hypothetical protein
LGQVYKRRSNGQEDGEEKQESYQESFKEESEEIALLGDRGGT